jgi:hypothetical protein
MTPAEAGHWHIRLRPKAVAPGVCYVVYTPEGEPVPYGRYPSLRSAFVRVDSELWRRAEEAKHLHLSRDLPGLHVGTGAAAG